MKRQNFLFEQIYDYGNIRLAFLKALRGNRNSSEVINFCRASSRNTEENLSILRNKLSSLNCDWGNYHSFTITDPKKRIISSAPFEQRIMHHAIMNILEPLFERQQMYHSYACRKGKGTHAAVLYAFKQCRKNPCFLKLDIRKYFDSINHDVLKQQLRRIIKDTRVLFLLDGIIDSYETFPKTGLPIGNLTSQFFANMYLSSLDHFIIEQLRPSAYCRYMDDFVLWASSQTELKAMYERINQYVTQNLCLQIKPPVFGKSISGLPFLGFLIKEKGIYLLQKSKRRFTARVLEINALLYHRNITEEKAAERVQSVFAAISIARTKNLRKIVLMKGEQFLARTV